MFGGKGHSVNFYKTSAELFAVMLRLADELKTESFFVMDENFLLNRERALGLLELMERHNKAWSLYIFSSANVLKSYEIDQLVRLGVSWVWLGLEGKNSDYAKLDGYMYAEVRFKSLREANPERAAQLLEKQRGLIERRYKEYRYIADRSF